MKTAFTAFPPRPGLGGRLSGVLAGIVLATAAHGGTHTWSGAGANALWSNAANWSSGGAPVGGETAVVLIFPSNATSFTTTPNVSNLVVDRMEFNLPSVAGSLWTVTNGGVAVTLSGAAGDNIRVSTLGNGVTWQPTLTLQNTCRLNTADNGASLDLQGIVAGPGGLVKLGQGGLLLSTGAAANTFTGLLSVQGGTLHLQKIVGTPCFGGNLEVTAGNVQIGRSHQIPDSASITITGGVLSTNPTSGVASVTEQLGPVTLSPTTITSQLVAATPSTLILGGGLTVAAGSPTRARITATAPSGQISLGGSTRTINVEDTTGQLDIFGNVVDGGAGAGIVKQGAGILVINDATSFSGPLTVAAGQVTALNGQALGSTIGGTVVQSGATLQVGNNLKDVTLPVGETIQLSGTLLGSGTSAVPGTVVLSGTPTLAVDFSRTLTLSGVVSGNPTAVSVTGGGTTIFSGTAPNTFGGLLTVTGTLHLGKTAGVTAIPGSVQLSGALLKLLAPDQIPDSASVVFTGGAGFDLNSQNETVSRVDGPVGSVRIALGNATLTLAGSGDAVIGQDTVSGKASIAGSEISRVRKLGAGTLTLYHNRVDPGNTFPTLAVEGGTVLLFDEWFGAIELKGGTLRGKATTGPIQGMGGSVCLCDFDAQSFSGPATVLAAINGDTPGTGFDQMRVDETVNLTGQTLQLSLGQFTPMTSGTFVIVRNLGNQPVTGTFAGLPEGALVTVGGKTFRISYRGGPQRRDVVLRFEGVGTPGPQIVSVRPIGGGTVEVKAHWLPGKQVTLERAEPGLTSWSIQSNQALDANGDATFTFQNFGADSEFVRLAVY